MPIGTLVPWVLGSWASSSDTTTLLFFAFFCFGLRCSGLRRTDGPPVADDSARRRFGFFSAQWESAMKTQQVRTCRTRTGLDRLRTGSLSGAGSHPAHHRATHRRHRAVRPDVHVLCGVRAQRRRTRGAPARLRQVERRRRPCGQLTILPERNLRA